MNRTRRSRLHLSTQVARPVNKTPSAIYYGLAAGGARVPVNVYVSIAPRRRRRRRLRLSRTSSQHSSRPPRHRDDDARCGPGRLPTQPLETQTARVT